MAGDIQEPLRLSFQADYFHCGSISFGRYETEDLCWERRSSFSHNRYLEEVERFSKPGSVTEKKAYFEAHFKRKALLSHSGIDSQNRENDNLQNMFQEDIEHPTEESYITSYDKSPAHPVHDQSEITEYGLEYSECLGPDIEHTSDILSNEENLVHENIEIEEAYETGSGILPRSIGVEENEAKQILNGEEENKAKKIFNGQEENKAKQILNGEQENEAKRILNGKDEAATSEESPKSSNWLPSCPATEIGGCMNEPSPASKVKIEPWTKLVNSKLMTSQVSRVKAKTSISIEVAKDFSTKVVNKECHTSSRSRKEKQIPDSTDSAMRSVPRTLKTLASQSSKTKLHENKSFNLPTKSTSKHTANSRPSTSERVASRAHQNGNRHMQAVNSTKPIMKQNSPAFSFKSDLRAERRKEFNMKMEEKMLAKETEAQQVKVKKQERTQADIKQLRKGLNFKAKPMPSFYNGGGHCLDKSKVVVSNYKTSKVQNKLSSPGVGSTKRSPSCRSVGSREASLNSHSPQVSGETSDPSAVSSNSNVTHLELADADSNSHPTSAASTEAPASKEGHEEFRRASLQNHRVPESEQMNKGKHKVGAQRRTKGVGLHNS